MKVIKNIATLVASNLWSCLAIEYPAQESLHNLTLMDMPTEMLVRILELTPDDELLGVRQVCREWNGLVLYGHKVCKNYKGKPQQRMLQNLRS
ncbi:F-box protein [Candidatus Odyssella thessalonicensis]|uniref:F-box protein n=1 Tax=Candidatus Odyssella thessalonicensis TaxID=84647 RepID=UPI000225C209|nr:F-box protein [Candidatus Odyssella thessalonicensis]